MSVVLLTALVVINGCSAPSKKESFADPQEVLNAFTNPRMNVPPSIKNSTEINNGEVQITVEQFSRVKTI